MIRFTKKSVIMALAVLAVCFMPAQHIAVFPSALTVEAASVKLNAKSKKLYVNDKFRLKVSGTKKHVMWRSDNKKVASVSSAGVVTAQKVGTATITATVGAGSAGRQLKCKITVRTRLSAKKYDVRLFPNRYEKVKINANGLKQKETVGLITKNNDVADITLSKSSKSFSVIVEPKEIGYTDFEVRIFQADMYDVVPQKDFITMRVFSYPDKSGWISEDDIAAFRITILPAGDGAYYVSNGNSGSGSGYVSDSFYLDPRTDSKVDANTWQSHGIRYQINKGTLFIRTADLEKRFFKYTDGRKG